MANGVKQADIPEWLGKLYSGVPQDQRGPGGHILTGPVAVAEAEPGDVLEVRVMKVAIDVPWACNSLGSPRRLLTDNQGDN